MSLKLAVALLALSAILVLEWQHYGVPLYLVYTLFVGACLLAFAMGWPREEWFSVASVRSKQAQQLRSLRRRKTSGKSVAASLRDTDVRAYCTREVRLHDTKELCESMHGHYAQKGIIYLLLVLTLLFIIPHKKLEEADRAVELLKAWAVFSAFAGFWIWDIAIALHQRSHNRQ